MKKAKVKKKWQNCPHPNALWGGGAKLSHKGNWPYLLDFWILDNKKVSGDSWDTSADPHRVQDQPWSFHGP